jgi:hypothetical protein
VPREGGTCNIGGVPVWSYATVFFFQNEGQTPASASKWCKEPCLFIIQQSFTKKYNNRPEVTLLATTLATHKFEEGGDHVRAMHHNIITYTYHITRRPSEPAQLSYTTD